MPKMYLKKVEETDMDLLFEWANDDVTRQNSFNSSKIDYEEHRKWFSNSMADDSIDMFIIYIESEAIGQMRLVYKGETASISYSVANKYRGQGLGKLMLQLIEIELSHKYPQVKYISGDVKLDNIASQKIFEDNCFEQQIVDESDQQYYRYTKKNNDVQLGKDTQIDVKKWNRGGGTISNE